MPRISHGLVSYEQHGTRSQVGESTRGRVTERANAMCLHGQTWFHRGILPAVGLEQQEAIGGPPEDWKGVPRVAKKKTRTQAGIFET